MDHRGSIYLGVLMVICMGCLLIIGTSISIHQISQKKVLQTTLAWKALWYGRNILSHWEVGHPVVEQLDPDMKIESSETAFSHGLRVNKIQISWQEGHQLKQITLFGYRPGLP
ncbi:MAG TPA: hypothetical protein VJ824_14745 [Bacillota bacterium]|nr:hypothetical protein [Bacillota bacterium]